MKEIPLSKGMVALVDDDDFDLVSQYKWHIMTSGHNLHYASAYIRQSERYYSRILMHRLILGLSKTSPFVDHVNNNGLDNRRDNLRTCERWQNNGNQRTGKRNKSGYKGVCWNKNRKKWLASICSRGVRIHIGLFDNAEDAARAYNQFARDQFGEFAKYNAITPLFPEQVIVQSNLIASNKSGFRGVSWNSNKQRWVAMVRRVFVGLFDDPRQAAIAADKKALELYGDRAKLNFPENVSAYTGVR